MYRKRSIRQATKRYDNWLFHYEVTLPLWWDDYLIADRSRLVDGEIYLQYLFRFEEKVYDPVFTVVISPYGKEIWRRRYEDSPLTYLGEYAGFSYSYLLPEELPDDFLKPDRSDYDYKKYGKPIRLLKKMVNSVPAVLRSFRFIG